MESIGQGPNLEDSQLNLLWRHSEILEAKWSGIRLYGVKEVCQGFLSSHGCFVERNYQPKIDQRLGDYGLTGTSVTCAVKQ